MSKANIVFTFSLLLSFATPLQAQVGLGERIPAFELPTFEGTSYVLNQQKDYNGFIFVFASPQCPSFIAYSKRLIKIWQLCKNSMIDFRFIFSNKSETDEEIKKYLSFINYPISSLDDRSKILMKLLDAKVTPEVFFFNKKRRLIYRGRIDSHQRQNKVIRKNLEEAIGEFLLNQKITNPELRPRGCKIR